MYHLKYIKILLLLSMKSSELKIMWILPNSHHVFHSLAYAPAFTIIFAIRYSRTQLVWLDVTLATTFTKRVLAMLENGALRLLLLEVGVVGYGYQDIPST